MKNLFLSLAFMLVGTFAFANTSDNSVDLNKIESLINVDSLEAELDQAASDCGFPVFYDTASGGTGSFHVDCSDDTSGNSDGLWVALICNFFWDCSSILNP